MKFEFKYTTIHIDPDFGCEVTFSNQEPDNEDLNEDYPYFIIQRQFEEPDNGSCYIECHVMEITGHYKFKKALLARTKLLLHFNNKKHSEVEIQFSITDAEYEELQKAMKMMIFNL